MIRKAYIILAVSVLCLVMITGCSNEKGNNVHIGVAEDHYKGLAAKDYERSDQLTVLHNLYRGLFEIENMRVVPVLVKEYRYNNDATQLIININENYLWSDGSPLTSDQVIESLLALENAQGRYSYQVQNIDWSLEEPITINEDHQIVVNLSRPNPYFHKLLAMPIFYPVKNTSDPLAGPFTGAFIVGEQSDNKLVLVPDSGRENAESIVTESIIITYGHGAETLSEKYSNRDFDVAFSQVHLQDGSTQKIVAPAIRLLWINSMSEPFADQNARQTLTDAINASRIVRELNNSEQELQGIYPSLFRKEAKESIAVDFDTHSFEGFSIRMLSLDDKTHRIVAEKIKEQLSQTDVADIIIEYAAPDEFYQKIRSADFDLALDQWEADIYGKYPFFELFRNPLHNPVNASALIIPEINVLQNELVTTSDPADREKIYAELERLIKEVAPAAFISEGYEKELYIQRIKNATVNPIYVTVRFDDVRY